MQLTLVSADKEGVLTARAVVICTHSRTRGSVGSIRVNKSIHGLNQNLDKGNSEEATRRTIFLANCYNKKMLTQPPFGASVLALLMTLVSASGSFVLPTMKPSTPPSLQVWIGSPVSSANPLAISELSTAELLNCSPPAIEHFPRPFMEPDTRRKGGVLLHVAVCLYAFLALAIVCENYFVPSVERLCETLRMSPDVAGATFLAAGSSAPELVAVGVGVFFAKDDIGVSGVIGSSVFNMMFVISVCALVSRGRSYLNWWPLCRDCLCYGISIVVMLFVIRDEKIYWKESLCLLLCYVGYCVVLRYNLPLELLVRRLTGQPLDCDTAAEKSHLVTYRANHGPGVGKGYATVKITPTMQKLSPEEDINFSSEKSRFRPREYDENNISLLYKPTQGGWFIKIVWVLCLPIYFACFTTIPDCRYRQFTYTYPITFVISIIWICFYSYIVIWMLTVIGSTLGIPDTVMGLTFVAIGVSVPDALSSLAVVKEGHANMAVSMAVGSNVFDMLIGLGLPWFIQTTIINPGGFVEVYSKGLTYSTVSLLSAVLFLYLLTYMNNWVMDKIYGLALMAWYVLFVGLATLTELNVFGYVNPPDCPSDY